jgi:hypothetical protein
VLKGILLVLVKDAYAVPQVHVRCSVVSRQVFIAGKNNACNQYFLNVDSPFAVCSKQIVGVLHGLHVLYEGEIIIPCTEDGIGIFESFMKGAKSQNPMFDGWLEVAQLKYLLAPQIGIEEFGPLGQSVPLEIEEGSVLCGLR